MDEKKLQKIFRDAVPEAPPPSFKIGDVRSESGRQRVRHRNALLGGSALGIALLTGAAVLGVALWRGTDSNETAGAAGAPMIDSSSGNAGKSSSEVPNGDQSPRAASGGTEQDKSFPTEPPKQGGTPTGNAGPQGPGSTLNGCGQADRELAAALAGELPAAAQNPVNANAVCPSGSRAFAFQLTDGGKSGLVTVVLVPPGAKVDYPVTGSPQGAVVGTGDIKKDGRRVYVITEPADGSTAAPLDDRVQQIAEKAAAKL
jgi:hypothetical protein